MLPLLQKKCAERQSRWPDAKGDGVLRYMKQTGDEICSGCDCRALNLALQAASYTSRAGYGS